jgi:hypothetical protein
MDRYDYREAIKADINYYIVTEGLTFDSREEFIDAMEETAWTEDSITGNASGSYTFNRWKAEEYLCHNLDLLCEACREFGSTPDLENPEACDVIIRCYLLYECIRDVAAEMYGD